MSCYVRDPLMLGVKVKLWLKPKLCCSIGLSWFCAGLKALVFVWFPQQLPLSYRLMWALHPSPLLIWHPNVVPLSAHRWDLPLHLTKHL